MENGQSMYPFEQRYNSASEVTVTLDAADFDNTPICRRLLGLIDYYEAIFKGKGLFKKEYEFRNNKLSMILDLISYVMIPEDIMSELRSTIIFAWRLKIPGSTREKRTGEINTVLHSIERLRTAIRWIEDHPGPDTKGQLDIAVLHSLSMRHLDLESTDIVKFRTS